MLAVTLTLVVSVAGLFALDIYEHHKLSTSAGLNVWGYRGPTVGRKQAGELRVLALGGSTTFGYGVHWQEAVPAYLEGLLKQQNAIPGHPVTVVNLGYNGEGAHSYKYTLQDYEYLNGDAVIFYTGYNDF